MRTEEQRHPKPDRLEAYAEGSLSEADRSELSAHVLTCGRCRTVLEEWEALFNALAAVPRPAPSVGFADRVLAGVRPRPAWITRILAWVDIVLPSTDRGWAFAGAVAVVPVTLAVTLSAWAFSRPWLDLQGLWIYMRDRVLDGAATWTVQTLESLATDSILADLLHGVLAGFDRIGGAELGLALLMLGTAAALSIWILYRNVIRTPTRDVHHVSHGLYCY